MALNRNLIAFSVFVLNSTLAMAGPVTRLALEYPAASTVAGEVPAAVAVDPQGHTYVAGTAAESSRAGQSVYVTKIDASGKNRLYTAHLGGSGAVWVKGIAVDRLGNVYVTGYTNSRAFPVVGGVQARAAGGLDAFVAKLDAKGGAWLYSTYLGGSGDDAANAIAVDHDGNAYVTGWTSSPDFPLRHALQSSKAGETDAFVAKLNPQGSALAYSTYAGGGLHTAGGGIAVDQAGAVYVAGEIRGRSGSAGILEGAKLEKDGFVLKLAADGSRREFSGLLGGAGTAVAVDSTGAAYVAGWREAAGTREVFATKFAADGASGYQASMGTWTGDAAPAIAVDAAGSAYVTGMAGESAARPNPQMVKLSADGSTQLASSSLDAVTASEALALAVDPSGTAMIAGTASTGRPYVGKVATCSYRLEAGLKHVDVSGGSGAMTVETTPECAWTAGASASWVQVSPSAADDGLLHYTVAANPGAPRGASIAVAGQTLLIMQAGVSPLLSGGFTGPIRVNSGFATNQVPACDDCSANNIAPLGFSINFFGSPYTQVWVNNNGNITFDNPLSTYSPNPIPTIPNVMIAPYWADVDTRVGTLVTYGQDTVNGHLAFGANFVNVGYYSEHIDKLDSFQVVLISRTDLGAGFFDIEFNYSAIHWETGDASGGSGGLGGDSSRVGFTNGSNTAGTYYELPGSGVNGAFLDGGPNALIANSVNSGGVLGRYVYGVRGGTIVCATGISAPAAGIGVSGGTLTVGVTASNSSCAWNVTQLPSWITVTSPAGGNGTGTGSVTLQVAAYTGSLRQATMIIAGQNYTVSQGGPDLAITKTHTPGWQPGDSGRTYTITVINQGGTNSSGTVTVTDTLPTGLTATAISGNGWTCSTPPTLTCTRGDGLVPFAQYPIILTVNVAGNAPGSVTNVATVSGGGSVTSNNKTASDQTGIGGPDMTITKSHTGPFHQGDTGDTYTITAINSGGLATTAPVTVTDQLPSGLTATAMAGLGWTCSVSTTSCTRSDALPPGTSYPPITLTVGVAGNAPNTVTNTAVVSGGGEANTSNDTVTDVTTIVTSGAPILIVSKSHSGNFHQGDTGDTYTINVANAANATAATSGTVTVTDTLPAGMTATAMSGTGWNCNATTVSCTRSDALAVSTSYPAIILTVNVSASAVSGTNTATVGGGGSVSNTANDSTTVLSGAAPVLHITKSHSGNFHQGDTADTYTLTVNNSGNAATSGTVTVSDTLPAGFTAVSVGGGGWSCQLGTPTSTCTRGDALAANTSYPAITLTVSVAATASSGTNSATVSGGGSASNSTTDATAVVSGGVPSLSITKTHAGSFHQSDTGDTYTITVTNSGSTTSSTVTVADTLPAGLTATAMSGTGWSCTVATATCTRSDFLSPNTSWPAITLTVNVSANAGSGTNTATVSGGGSASNSANDATTVLSGNTATACAASFAGQWNVQGATLTFNLGSDGFLSGSILDGFVAGNVLTGFAPAYSYPMRFQVSADGTTLTGLPYQYQYGGGVAPWRATRNAAATPAVACPLTNAAALWVGDWIGTPLGRVTGEMNLNGTVTLSVPASCTFTGGTFIGTPSGNTLTGAYGGGTFTLTIGSSDIGAFTGSYTPSGGATIPWTGSIAPETNGTYDLGVDYEGGGFTNGMAYGYHGRWNTPFGLMTLKVNTSNSTVTGSYPNGGSIVGSVSSPCPCGAPNFDDGVTLLGTYTDSLGSSGSVSWTMLADFIKGTSTSSGGTVSYWIGARSQSYTGTWAGTVISYNQNNGAQFNGNFVIGKTSTYTLAPSYAIFSPYNPAASFIGSFGVQGSVNFNGPIDPNFLCCWDPDFTSTTAWPVVGPPPGLSSTSGPGYFLKGVGVLDGNPLAFYGNFNGGVNVVNATWLSDSTSGLNFCPAASSPFTGTFITPLGVLTVVSNSNGTLTGTIPGGWLFTGTPNGNTWSGTYTGPSGSGTFTFTNDGNGFTGSYTPTGSNTPVPFSGNPSTEPLVTNVVATEPPGQLIQVDGVTYTAPQVVNWTAGSSHTIGAVSPQAASGTQYLFINWGDGLAQIHSVVAPNIPTTYTATYRTQYLLTLNSGNGGTVNTAGGYYDAGTLLSLAAVANAGQTFSGWSGSGYQSYTGLNNPATVRMNSPIAETASFAAIVSSTITTNPPGLQVTVDGSTLTAPQVVTWVPGSSHSIGVPSPQGSGGTQNSFTSWSDGGALSHNVLAPSINTTYTANFTTQFLLTANVSPAGSGSVTASPASATGYYNVGQVVSLTAAANAGSLFANWSGGLTGSANPQPVTLNAATTVTANFVTSTTSGLGFFPLNPCRVVDTRAGSGKTGAFGPPTLGGASIRSFVLPAGTCTIPSNAQAYSLTITAVPAGASLSYLTAWPTGQSQPTVSTLNAPDGAVTANLALLPVPSGNGGSVSIFVSDPADVIIDINGYFAPPGGGALAFYAVTPCRIVDTRAGGGKTGAFGPPSLPFNEERDIPVPSAGCGIPSTALAYSLNATVLPSANKLNFLTAWPTGTPLPVSSTLNSTLGKVTAAATIVGAGANGSISIYASDTTDVLLDINGYFAPPGNPGALFFHPLAPCRLADTRGNGFTGPFGQPAIQFQSERDFPLQAGNCGLPAAAQAYSLNITAVPPAPLTYLTTWQGSPTSLPVVSTLNSFDGRYLANAAIVPAGSGGLIGVFVSNTTNVIIDTNGYFGQ